MSTKIELGSPTDHTKREMFLRHWWSLAGHFVCEDLNLDIVCKTVSLDDFNYNHYSYEFYGENNNNKYVKILEIFQLAGTVMYSIKHNLNSDKEETIINITQERMKEIKIGNYNFKWEEKVY